MITADPVLFSIRLLGRAIAVTPWMIVGLLGTALFSARVLIQWIASERAKRIATPAAFWWTSLLATLVMMAYSAQQSEIAFLLGYSMNLIPYSRNLVLLYSPRRLWRRIIYVVAAGVLFGTLAVLPHPDTEHLRGPLALFGFAAVLIWNLRFVAQWLYAERHRESTLPMWFWIWSLVGQLLCLVYAIFLRDVVFIVGFAFNSIPIIRNIMLANGNGQADESA